MLASASKVRAGNDLFRTIGDDGESSVNTPDLQIEYSVLFRSTSEWVCSFPIHV